MQSETDDTTSFQTTSDDDTFREEVQFNEFLEKEQKNYTINEYISEVLEFSSQYGNDESISYTAINLSGKPSKYPEYGDFPESFMLRSYGHWWSACPSAVTEYSRQNVPENPAQDFIIVKFDEYLIPNEDGVKIYETFNPGAVIRIWALTVEKDWILLWSGAPQICEKKARIFSPPIKKLSVGTKILKVEFNHSLCDYYTALDAILLIGKKCNYSSNYLGNLQRKGPILKKLEVVQFQPKLNGDIEEFLKKDLNKFIAQIDVRLQNVQNENCDSGLAELPYEILFTILSFLDLKSLFKTGQVCRKLKEVCADPLLYLDINLKPYWHCADSSLLNTLTKRASLVKRLDLSWCTFSSADFKAFIIANGATITNLRLNSCKFLNTSNLELICMTCVNLKELSLRNYINVHETNSRDFLCLSMLSSLERLDLFRTGIEATPLLNILKNNTNLRHLNLGFSSIHVNMDEICLQCAKYNKKIISIDMWKSHSLTSVGIRALADCTDLEEIDFGWCLRDESSPSESLKVLVQNCKNLKKIFLAAIRGLSDRDLENIKIYCKNLEQLDLMGIMGISTDMCFEVLKCCLKLELLDLSFCELDEQKVYLWQQKFKNVSIKRSFVPSD